MTQADDTDNFIASVTPPSYKCTHVLRTTGRGGGIGLFIRDDLCFKPLLQLCFHSESISVQLSISSAQKIDL